MLTLCILSLIWNVQLLFGSGQSFRNGAYIENLGSCRVNSKTWNCMLGKSKWTFINHQRKHHRNHIVHHWKKTKIFPKFLNDKITIINIDKFQMIINLYYSYNVHACAYKSWHFQFLLRWNTRHPPQFCYIIHGIRSRNCRFDVQISMNKIM